MDDLERAFHRSMVGIYETARQELGYNATRFMQMVTDIGGLATAKRLLNSDQASDGFTTLWEQHRLDLSVEAHAIRPEFAALFDDDELAIAHDRLAAYGYRPPASPTD